MRKSTNYELNLLDEDDFYNEELFNENTEKIDEVMKSLDTPEYDISLQKDVEQLSSGESLRVALRKIAKAVKTLIEHLANKENPHGVSAKDVGLGEVTNESKETMFTNPTFTGTTNAEGYGFGDNAVHPTKVTPYEREYDNTGTTHKTTMVGINAGLHLDGDLEAANFQGLASKFTTENWKMGAAAPLVKQLYEENQSLKEEISTLNSNLSVVDYTSSINKNDEVISKIWELQLHKVGSIAVFVLNVSVTELGRTKYIGTLQEGIRPAHDISYNTVTNKGDPCYFFVNANGSFGITKIGADFNENEGVRFCAAYAI